MARILVIDDNADLLQMIRMFLEGRGGHEVVLSAEGEDGLAKAFANPPDLAIVDVMMPGMTGYEVCRRLRQEPSTADIPILILTARGQSVDREAALEAGADEHLAKPVTMTELLNRVNGLLARKAAEREPAAQGVVAFLSLRGGVGVTTLAVNMALLLAKQGTERVCLVDLCPSSGHAALQLGLRPEPNWSKLLLGEAVPDEAAVHDALLQHSSGLYLLAAPFLPLVGRVLSPQAVRGVLSSLLRRGFDLVVVDLPSVLDGAVMAVLEMADSVNLVTTPDPASIQSALGALQALKPLGKKLQPILNQVVPGPTMPREGIERVLKRSLAASVPFDSAQTGRLAQGQPLAVAAPTSPLVQGVARLAHSLGVVLARQAS